MSALTPITVKAGQDTFDYAAFISWAKSSTTPEVGSNQVNIVDADWRPKFDMDDHNRMCRQLGIVPQCDIVAASKEKADAASKEKADGQPKEKAAFRLRTF